QVETLGPRGDHAVAYDAARGTLVLFGGGPGQHAPYGATWLWDGASWRRSPAAGPPPRRFAAMAYDRVRDVVVLFGGLDAAGSPLADTWEWDGAAWTERVPAQRPTARAGHALAWDPGLQEVLLFGGDTDLWLSSYRNDTWAWNGSDWRQLARSGVLPAPRAHHGLASDLGRRRVVLFGGRSLLTAHGTTDDTWEWDGQRWLQRQPAASPLPREQHAMAYDAQRGRVL